MNKKNKNTAKSVALTGMLFALACVLSLLENAIMLPLMPGIKLGLANIVVMYALFFFGVRYATLLVILKALFNLLVQGAMAGALSLAGGIISLLAIILVRALTKKQASYTFLSITGAVFHNLGQLLIAGIVFKYSITLYYAPVLIISGIAVGSITAWSLKLIMPALEKIGINNNAK